MMRIQRIQLAALFISLLTLGSGNPIFSQPNAGQPGLYNVNVANVPYQSGLIMIPRFSEAKYVQTIDGMSTVHYESRSKFTVGNPYLYENFLPGEMTLKEGTVLENLPVRYNIERNIMEFIYITDTLDIIDPKSLSSIKFAEKEFIYHVGMEGIDRVEGSYFEVLYQSNNVKLLLKRTARLERDEYLNNYAGGFGTGDLYYEKDEKYFMMTGNGSAVPVRTRKDIIKLYPEHKKKITSFWKEENIRFKNQQDLLKISDFIADIAS